MGRGFQLDQKTTPIHQMRILKFQKKEERPKKLEAIKHKAKNIYRFCCALSALRAKKHRINQTHFAPKRRKAKKYIDFFFQIALFFTILLL
jgi:endo-1,4-beta-D-glucanase Y